MLIDHEASINWDDGQIRFWPGYRLDKEERQATKAAVLTWSRGEECFKGAWTPGKEDFLGKQFGIEELYDDETSLLGMAESRADHFQGWSDNAATRSEQAHNTVNNITKHIPMGQPILVGHHSEKRARADQARIDSNMRKAIDAGKRAKYWQSRAKRAVAAAERRYEPGVIARRIKKLEAQLRKQQKEANREYWEANWGPEWAERDGHDPEVIWAKNLERAQRWIDFLEKRLEYQRALYAESGGVPAETITFEVGGAVQCWAGLCEIKRVNKKSLTVMQHIRDDIYWKELIPYDKVKRAFTKEEYQAAKAKHAEA